MKVIGKLKFVSFENIESWSASFLFGTINKFNRKYKILKISQLLIKKNESVIIEDEKLYKRITVKINANGVVLRDEEYGKNIGTKRQFIAKEGQMIVSKIDARNGAFGLIPSELDGAIVTNDFPLFDINHHLVNKNYLILLAKTNLFVDFAKSCSSGTTNRQRMDMDKFLTLEIPLPSISEQETIVKNYYDKITQATTYEQQAETLEKNIESYLFESLGIEQKTEQKTKKKGLQFVEFGKLEKWGIDFILSTENIKHLFTMYKISDLCKISSGGTPSRGRKEYFEGSIPWIKTGELNDAIIYDTEEKITEEAIKNSSAKLYKKDSLVIAMYGATIGKTAKLGIEATTNQACAVLFDINTNLIEIDFLWEYLQSQTKRLKKMAYGSAQPNLNAKIISNYNIPIPPKETQQAIINQIDTYKNEIKILRERATLLKQQAEQEFEQTIFS